MATIVIAIVGFPIWAIVSVLFAFVRRGERHPPPNSDQPQNSAFMPNRLDDTKTPQDEVN